MFTTAGAARCTSGAKDHVICWRDWGTCRRSVWAMAGAGPNPWSSPGESAPQPTRTANNSHDTREARTLSHPPLLKPMPFRWRSRRLLQTRRRIKKAARRLPLLVRSRRRRRLRRLFLLVLVLHGSGVDTLRVRIAIHQLDHRHRRGIAIAEAGPQDPGIAARPVRIALRQGGEQLAYHRIVVQLRRHLPPRMQVAPLAQRDQLLDVGPK